MAQLESCQTKDYTNMEHENFVPYRGVQYPEAEMLQRSRDFYEWLNQRRSVRVFSDRPVPREVIDNIIMAASTAPSGAHKQPWTFCVVSDPAIKTAIREAAEAEEYTNYHGRMSDEWLADLRPFGRAQAFFRNCAVSDCGFQKIVRRSQWRAAEVLLRQ